MERKVIKIEVRKLGRGWYEVYQIDTRTGEETRIDCATVKQAAERSAEKARAKAAARE